MQLSDPTKKQSTAASHTFIWLLCFLICVDLGLSLLFRQQKSTLPMSKYEGFLSSSNNPDVLVLGSSVAVCSNYFSDTLKNPKLHKIRHDEYWKAAYLQKVLEEKTGRPLQAANLAYLGAMVSDDWLVAKKILEYGKQPAVIIYEMTSRDFFDASMPELGRTPVFSQIAYMHPHSENSYIPLAMRNLIDGIYSSPICATLSLLFSDHKNITDPEKFFSFCDSIAGSISYVYKNRSSAKSWLTQNVSAALNRKSSIYESVRQSLEEQKRKNPFASPYSCASGSIEVDPKPQVKRYDAEIAYFEKLLQLCHQAGIAFVVVDMPVTDEYRRKVPVQLQERFPEDVEALCHQYGATYLDFNQKHFASDEFKDFIHLNPKGSLKLNELIAEEIAQRQLAKISAK